MIRAFKTSVKPDALLADDSTDMKKRNTVGCLFYIALILLLMVIFLFNRATVHDVMERTGFLEIFKKESSPPKVVISPLNTESPDEPVEQPENRELVLTPEESAPREEAEEEHPAPKIRQARLFFVLVASDGSISLKGIIRPVEYTDAPLRSTLLSLFKGPSPAEINQGMMTLIPPDTRINAIHIENNIAYLDFNESFRFNALGKEGLAAQLKQIVYSTTEFSNLNKVQILIEGKKLDYLGPEGVFIGKPLGRDDF
jgi:germination protein M